MAKIIDLNSRQAFFQHHFSDSCNLPFVELIDRVYELPPKGSSLILIGAEDVLSQGREFFQQRHYTIESAIITKNSEDFWTLEAPMISEQLGLKVESGNFVSKRLWKPSPILEKFMPKLEMLLNGIEKRTVLDLGCGSGRDGVYFAERGFSVTGVDYDPLLLSKAQMLAKLYNCDQAFRTLCLDLERTSQEELLQNLSPVDVIYVGRYLYRPLFQLIRKLMRPGSVFIMFTFTQGVEVFGKPKKARYILEKDELKKVFCDYKIIEHGECAIEDGRPVQFIFAQCPNELEN